MLVRGRKNCFLVGSNLHKLIDKPGMHSLGANLYLQGLFIAGTIFCPCT